MPKLWRTKVRLMSDLPSAPRYGVPSLTLGVHLPFDNIGYQLAGCIFECLCPFCGHKLRLNTESLPFKCPDNGSLLFRKAEVRSSLDVGRERPNKPGSIVGERLVCDRIRGNRSRCARHNDYTSNLLDLLNVSPCKGNWNRWLRCNPGPGLSMVTDRSCFRHSEKMEEEARNSRKGHPRIATPSRMEEKFNENWKRHFRKWQKKMAKKNTEKTHFFGLRKKKSAKNSTKKYYNIIVLQYYNIIIL